MDEKEYIEREAFVEQKRKQYCEDCNRRKGMKNGKCKTLYEIGEAPCRACGIDDMLNDVEDFPAADVAPIKRGKWVKTKEYYTAGCVFLRVAWKCSCCGIEVVNTEPIYRIDDWYYCPNCGADMRPQPPKEE